jgi:hypothetical protein
MSCRVIIVLDAVESYTANHSKISTDEVAISCYLVSIILPWPPDVVLPKLCKRIGVITMGYQQSHRTYHHVQ